MITIRSLAYKWLSLDYNRETHTFTKESINKIAKLLKKPTTDKDLASRQVSEIFGLPLSNWLRFAYFTTYKFGADLEDETSAPVLDFEFFHQFPISIDKKKLSTPIVYWIDHSDDAVDKLPLNFVAFDTETTGVNVKKDKIIQISAVKYRNGKMIDKFDSLVNPRQQLLPTITQITGITTDQVLQAKDFIDVAPAFLKFIKGENLVGQNIIAFDLPLVLRECKDNKLDFGKYNIYDTLPMAHKAFPGRKHYNQESLDKYLQLSQRIVEKGYLKHNVLHNSLNDSLTTGELYLVIRDTLTKQARQEKR